MRARSLLCVAFAAACLVSHSARSADEERPPLTPIPDATLELHAKNVAAGVGFAWGAGKLSYKGKEYEVTVDGLTIGSVGVTAIEATGTVYRLAKLDDFAGNYTAAVAGSTVGGGGAWLVMRNQHDVEVRMHATTLGVSLTIGTSGVTLALKK